MDHHRTDHPSTPYPEPEAVLRQVLRPVPELRPGVLSDDALDERFAELLKDIVASAPRRSAQQRSGRGITPREAALWALSRACNGWRRNRVCTDGAGRALADPHPACVRAQQVHDGLLGSTSADGT